MEKLERIHVEGSLDGFRKRLLAAQYAAEAEGFTAECDVMMSFVDEICEVILNATDAINTMNDCTFREVMAGIASMLTNTVHSVSLGPHAVSEMMSNMISAVESIEDGLRQNKGTPGLMTFNRITKRFENYPAELNAAVALAESKIKDMNDPSSEQVTNALIKAIRETKVDGFEVQEIKKHNRNLH